MSTKSNAAADSTVVPSSGRRPLMTTTMVLMVGVAVVLLATQLTSVAALDCIQCGEYNDDGVGAITPCLNYSDALAHRYLKRCPRASHKFCIKYVSELSVVRDCVEECKEKEIWDTRTYCCNEDGCNAANTPFAAASLPAIAIAAITAVVLTTSLRQIPSKILALF